MSRKIEVGNKVAVLDDVLQGIVVKIEGNSVWIESSDGFPFVYEEHELVVLGESQKNLSRYVDISNEDMLEKEEDSNPSKKAPLFKSDLKEDKAPPMEVDLHIQSLTTSVRGLDKYDILQIQMDEAKRKLEFAIRSNIQKLVFIHGVGAGVLKTELEYLLKNYAVKSYAASFKKYGLGATEVYIFQNPKRK